MEIHEPTFIYEKNKISFFDKKILEISSTQNIYHVKTKPILLQKAITTHVNEYSLTPDFIDPSKSSPPNEFLIKLYARIDKFQKKEINLCNEY